MLKQMMQVMSEKYAGSMKGVPDLPLDGDDGNQKKRSSRKGGRGSSNKKSKDSGGCPSGAAVGAAGAAMRVLEYLKASDATDKLTRKEEQLSRDKDHAICLAEEHHQRCITHIFDLEMRFDRQGLTPEEYKEHQYYKYATENIEQAKLKLEAHEEKIEQLEKEIEELKASEDSMVNRELFAGTDDSAKKTPAGSSSLARFREEHGDEFPTAPNNGSDDELDPDYQGNSAEFNDDILDNGSDVEVDEAGSDKE
jgi:hypothetical protein